MAGRWMVALVVTALVGSLSIATSRASAPMEGRPARQLGQWTTANLSEAREKPAVARVGTKVLFAGGCAGRCQAPRRITPDGRVEPWEPSAAVDIYDSATGQWSTTRLSEARLASQMAVATVGSQVLFAGGVSHTWNYAYRHSDQVDLFDDATGSWSTHRLSAHWGSLTATVVGTKVLFIGGGNDPSGSSLNIGDENYVAFTAVDIYDSATRQWSVAALSVAHTDGNLKAATVGNLVLITGNGRGPYSTEADTGAAVVDIFDNASGRWSTASLSQTRYGTWVATVGTQVLVIGGTTGPGVTPPLSSVVDIYDNATGQWFTSQLPQVRGHLQLAVVGTQLLIIGYEGSNLDPATEVFVYDSATKQWSTAPLSEARSSPKMAKAGNQVLIAGGMHGRDSSAAVDIYDSATERWSTASLSQARIVTNMAIAGSQVLFGGPSTSPGDQENVVDIYDSATGGWFSLSRPEGLRDGMGVASVNTQAMFAGGRARALLSTRVDIYDSATRD